ncbi:MAG TPA: hypothetical protein VEB21_00845 [Terriglobales bacterium]|nr:hypothetical protein [Terriglobales bacterium]
MQQVLALGKWSKSDQKWKMVVAMRRPGTPTKVESRPAADRLNSRRPEPAR